MMHWFLLLVLVSLILSRLLDIYLTLTAEIEIPAGLPDISKKEWKYIDIIVRAFLVSYSCILIFGLLYLIQERI